MLETILVFKQTQHKSTEQKHRNINLCFLMTMNLYNTAVQFRLIFTHAHAHTDVTIYYIKIFNIDLSRR